MTKMQVPSDGCVNCGLAVRTRKGGEWLCSVCYRTLRAHDAGRHADQPIAQCGQCVATRRDEVRAMLLANVQVWE